MKKIVILASLILLLGGTSSAEAMGFKKSLANLSRVALHIDDQSSDGCWNNSKAAMIYVEKELLSAGVEVVKKDYQSLIKLSTLSVKARSGLCALRVELELEVEVMKTDNTFGARGVILWGDFFSREALISGGPEHTSKAANDHFREFAAELALKVMKDTRAAQKSQQQNQPRTDKNPY